MTATRTSHLLPVASVDRVCADAVAITFDAPDDFTFRAGQYLTVAQVVDGVRQRRSYSICAPVGAPPRIGVRRVPGGLFSTRLVDSLRPGDVLEVLPPQGNFTPEPDRPAYHCLIAAGSGITPVLSILDTVLGSNVDSRATLLYGNRRSDTVMFVDELADLKDTYPERFQLVHVLSREPRDVELFSGRLDAARVARLLDTVVPSPDVDEWWLCGPFDMVRGVQGVLAERGVPADRVHRELFYVDQPPPAPEREEQRPDGPSVDLTMRLDGRETTLSLPRSTPILDAAQRVRADIPFACKGGVCGTCRARVVTGEVRMRRNYALEPHELAAGFVLTCQSLPVTDTITIDYDT